MSLFEWVFMIVFGVIGTLLTWQFAKIKCHFEHMITLFDEREKYIKEQTEKRRMECRNGYRSQRSEGPGF